MAEPDASHALVADIGGTNARFAIASLKGGRPDLRETQSFACADYSGPAEAIAAYYDGLQLKARPERAVIAAAGPVRDNAVTFINSDWAFSGDEVAAAIGAKRVQLMNDFAVNALAIPFFEAGDLEEIGTAINPLAEDHKTAAIIGPGTGFGVAGLVMERGQRLPLMTEGGHIGFAPADDVERDIERLLAEKFGRTSVERILSGPGLVNLYGALARIRGAPAEDLEPADITARALQKADPVCEEAVDRFIGIFGAVAGDAALIMGARAGVYLTGGLTARLRDRLISGAFRERFVAKGRYRAYMSDIPTFIVKHPAPALIGAAARALA